MTRLSFLQLQWLDKIRKHIELEACVLSNFQSQIILSLSTKQSHTKSIYDTMVGICKQGPALILK